MLGFRTEKVQPGSKSEPAFSPASEADREWCARLMAASDPWVTLGRDIEQCRAICSHPEHELFVARVEGRLQAFILVHPCGAMAAPYVRAVAVAPEFHGRGLGTRLMNFVEDHYRGRSRHIFLCVSSFNRDALRLYKRLGYEVVGELTDYIIPGASEILMHKRLR